MNGLLGISLLLAMAYFAVLLVRKKSLADGPVVGADTVLAKEAVKITTATVSQPWPFYSKSVLSAPEQLLYQRLIEAMPGCLVMPQVQLSRFLGVKEGHNFLAWSSRLNQMGVDFLVCRVDLSVIAAFDIDTSIHEFPSRLIAAKKKAKALTDAGVKLHRVNFKDIPDVAHIKDLVSQTV